MLTRFSLTFSSWVIIDHVKAHQGMIISPENFDLEMDIRLSVEDERSFVYMRYCYLILGRNRKTFWDNGIPIKKKKKRKLHKAEIELTVPLLGLLCPKMFSCISLLFIPDWLIAIGLFPRFLVGWLPATFNYRKNQWKTEGAICVPVYVRQHLWP